MITTAYQRVTLALNQRPKMTDSELASELWIPLSMIRLYRVWYVKGCTMKKFSNNRHVLGTQNGDLVITKLTRNPPGIRGWGVIVTSKVTNDEWVYMPLSKFMSTTF